MGTPYLLGLDLGVASIGWVLLDLDDGGRPCGVRRVGSHLFESGSGSAAEFEAGRDEPPAKPRRDARQLRKIIWRRARRKRSLLRRLQRAGLMPQGDVSTPMAIDTFMKALDAELVERWNEDATHREHQVLPYRIRAAGLDRDLRPFEFGRVLYHLAQRRGFKSNRKAAEKPDEKSVVKQGISELTEAMRAANARTLGEYLASVDPTVDRIRRRWTSRAMYENEFDQLWRRQTSHLNLTDEHRSEVRDAIFHQRPLKSSDHLIGRCRHLPNHKRAPISCRDAQRFRLLQKVNDLQLVSPMLDKQPLDEKQRATILDHLACGEGKKRKGIEVTHAVVSMATLRKAINAPKGFKFNFETDGEKSLPGHKTDIRLAGVIPGYSDWPESKKTALVDELLGQAEDDDLRVRLREGYGLNGETIAAVMDVALEDEYAMLSREALRRLLPRMEQGDPYMTVARNVFPDEFEPADPLDTLPAVKEHEPDLRNPTVVRGLTELRKLVNLIIKRYGKPSRIHVELLRDLKKSREARSKTSRLIQTRRREREKAAERIIAETNLSRASQRDVEKWLLAEECRWQCPFTGQGISPHTLFVESEFEIEHIWPYARSLDDSFINKTLAHRDANRAKGNCLPAEVFGDERMEEIIGRVSSFAGDLRDVKLQRFKATEIPEGFTERQLRDSSYLAKAAANYLALLYGGIDDADGTKRVQTRTGGLTAQLRRLWELNGILGDGNSKQRDDHRHHAIDAAIVAAADTRITQEMMRVASEQISFGQSRLRDLPPPWPTFGRELAEAIDQVIVSHRQSRRVSGKLHAESNYSRAKIIDGQPDKRTIRKPVERLTVKEVDRIVDPRIRAAVTSALEASAASSPDKAFAEENYPTWQGRLVKRVTIIVKAKPFDVGKQKHRRRHVDSTPGSNHHVRIIATLAPDGSDKKWRDEIVTRMDVHERKSAGMLGLDTKVGEDERFVFSLAANEYVELDVLGSDGVSIGRMICRVLSVSPGDFEFVRHTDARTAQDRKANKERLRGGANWLMKRNARKVFVNYLGEVKDAGG
ncbi:MAG: type II CRISPR RNA-guided endonuclease Cas9 [Planctomycetota bacterium]